MNDDDTNQYPDTFNSIIDDFTFPSVVLDISDWPTQDLVTLSLKIDAELQKRAGELGLPIEDEGAPW
jgi:hypothetical protein